MGSQVIKRRFTVEEFHRIGEAGIFSEDDRLELIDGEIVQTTPIGSRHAACVDRCNSMLSRLLGERAIVRVQSPIRLDEVSEPQPDLALLRHREDFYASGHPGPQDVLLVIEVSEHSSRTDRDVKLPLYAKAGIQEAWLIDLAENAVEAFRDPSAERYRAVRPVRRGQRVGPQAFPDIALSVDGIFGL